MFRKTMLTVALWLPCAPALAVESIDWHHNLDAAWQTTRSQERPLLLFITSDDCRYCVLMKDDSWQNAHVAAHVNDQFVAVQVDSEMNRRLMQVLNVQILPTTLIISPDRRVLERFSGYVAPQQLLKRLEQLAAEQQGQFTQPTGTR